MTATPFPQFRWEALFCLLALLASPLFAQEAKDYQSVWAQLYPQTLEPRGDKPSDIVKDFREAAATTTLEEGLAKWKAFKDAYAAEDDEFEDAVHERYWKWAKKELRRVRMLTKGDADEATKVEELLREAAKEADGQG